MTEWAGEGGGTCVSRLGRRCFSVLAHHSQKSVGTRMRSWVGGVKGASRLSSEDKRPAGGCHSFLDPSARSPGRPARCNSLT